MSAKIITIAQQKGGAGKTTVAAQLAVALAATGKAVTVMDIDPQGSLAGWHKVRETRDDLAGSIALSQVAGWRLGTELDRLRNACDIVIIDSPPHAETDAKSAIRVADLVLLPMQPSPMDLWATQATLDLAAKEKTPHMLVLNRLPPRGKVVDAMRAAIAEQNLPLANSTLGNRTAFAASMMEGRGVLESAARSLAAQEVNALAQEVINRIK